jgi:hypothetical protein
MADMVIACNSNGVSGYLTLRWFVLRVLVTGQFFKLAEITLPVRKMPTIQRVVCFYLLSELKTQM